MTLLSSKPPLKMLLILPLILQVVGIIITIGYVFTTQGGDANGKTLVLLCLVWILVTIFSSLMILRYANSQHLKLYKPTSHLNNKLEAEIQRRKLIEATLMESEALFQDVLNNTIAAIACFRIHLPDYQRESVYFSAGQQQVFGYTPEELSTDLSLFCNRLHPGDQAAIWDGINERTCREGSLTVEYRYYHPDGKMRWISDHLLSRWDEAKQYWFVTAVGIDITDRKLAEFALRESEAKFRSAFHENVISMNMCNIQGQFLQVNQAFCHMLGYSEAEILSLSFQDVTYPEDLDLDQSLHTKVMAGEIPFYHLEKRYVAKDGGIIWALLSVTLVRDQENQPLYGVSHIQDITSRKQAEVNLLEQRNFFQQVLNTVPNPIFVKDAQGHFITANQAAAAIYSVSVEEMIGRGTDEFNLNSGQVEEFLADNQIVMSERKAKTSSIQSITNIEGQIFYYYTVISPFLDSQGEVQGIIGASTDVTELKKVEAELRQAKEAADGASQAKSTFLAHMSHELRTPLNAILGFSKLIQPQSNLTREQQENLGIIISNGNHLLILINQVLDLSKIEAGKATFQGQHFDLHQLLFEVTEMFRLQASQQGLELGCNCSPAVPQYIYTDALKLRQILLNLIGNALKFTIEGSVTIKVELLENLAPRNSALAPEVNFPITLDFRAIDTGVGIAPEEIDQLFQPFSQTRSGQNAPEGTGLGLSISKSFVQLLGGDMQLQSQLGKGTIITFQISAKRSDEQQILADKYADKYADKCLEVSISDPWPEYQPIVKEFPAIAPALPNNSTLTLPSKITPTDFADIPHHWLKKLSVALVVGDLQIINALIEELSQVKPSLVPILKNLVSQYQFEFILSLVHPLTNPD